MPQQLAPETYIRMFEVLLWCEEFKISYGSLINTPCFHQTKKIHTGEIWRGSTCRTLESNIGPPSTCLCFPFRTRPGTDGFASLPVPGLAEKRPSVLIGDEILVQPGEAIQGGRWYSGFVHVIERDEVGLRFGRGFRVLGSDERFYVRFKYNRIVSRREQHAIKATAAPVHRLQFPVLAHVKPPTMSQEVIATYNPDIETNPAQKRAVSSIVRLPPGSPPFIVFGP